MKNPIVNRVKKCSRCGEDHIDMNLEAKPFTQEPYHDSKNRKYHFTHFIICPNTDQPILVRLQDNPGDKDPYVMDRTRD